MLEIKDLLFDLAFFLRKRYRERLRQAFLENVQLKFGVVAAYSTILVGAKSRPEIIWNH